MTDETAIAFELPHVRAAATAGGVPHDRISVRDYVREVEIGAFLSERGVKQRIRFNVVLEVTPHVAAQDDDVDKVISYDTIIHAIEAQLSAGRINLLETLAERVAERCLSDARSIRVFVRIEKLDRIPGALGVEIVRMRKGAEAVALRPAEPLPDEAVRPEVRVAGDRAVLDAVAGPTVLVVPPLGEIAEPFADEAARRIALLSLDQGAWAFAGSYPRCTVVATRTEMDWALRQGLICIWAPSKIVLDAVEGPEALTQGALAEWFARQVG
ncbi:dihydroneopterin aldolase [Roseobacter sp. HKCCA0434]|uniref:dihydroneopterin aldolase n=1 Tax=Roseobacter sp. HKCCA0434 TaxID=3079297 RepID=UPI002905EB56|nr:dihydroneopterin aldolase [Roseobacter sp. HKCCA0434]